MIFHKTKLEGVYIIEIERIEDQRGFFARTWCKKEFESYGLNPNIAQISIAFSPRKKTLRGMHFQHSPHEEAKLVRCTKGAIYDVALDLRPHSITYKQWVSVELTENNYKMIYVPEGFAHGYQTLEDNSEVLYNISEFHKVEAYAAVRWNDPAFQIKWPFIQDIIISEKDKNIFDYKI